MKAAPFVLVLLCATIGLGFPIKFIFTADTPTIMIQKDTNTNALTQSQGAVTAEEQDRLRPSPVTASDERELDSAEPNPARGQPKSGPDSYGTLVGKFISNDDHTATTIAKAQTNHHDSTKETITHLSPADLLDIIDNHGPECVGLALFVLVPIAYFVLELLELAVKSCVREQFPRRGRDRVRLLGPERQLRAWRKREREMRAQSEKEKGWWQARRGR